MKLALIQTQQNELYNFPDTRHYSRKEVQALRKSIVDRTLAMIETAASHGVDLILTTEAFNFSGQFHRVDASYTDLYSDTLRPEEDACATIAKNYHTYIMAGLIRKEDDGKLYNSAVCFDRNGSILDVYHKMHLAGDENEIFMPGDKPHTINTEFGRIGPAICWDMQFPETARELAKAGCDLILCPTWGWEWIYGPARAYENGIYVAAAMAVPYWMSIQDLRRPSQVISPDGQILAQGSDTSEDIIYCDIPDIHCTESRKFRLRF